MICHFLFNSIANKRSNRPQNFFSLFDAVFKGESDVLKRSKVYLLGRPTEAMFSDGKPSIWRTGSGNHVI